MNKLQFRQLIREEIRKVLKENKGTPLSAQDKKDLKNDLMHIYKEASKGNDMTDDLAYDLGDYFEKIQATKDKKLIDAYEDLRAEADNDNVPAQAKLAKALLALLK